MQLGSETQPLRLQHPIPCPDWGSWTSPAAVQTWQSSGGSRPGWALEDWDGSRVLAHSWWCVLPAGLSLPDEGPAGGGGKTAWHQGRGAREHEDLHGDPAERCLHPIRMKGGQREAA